MDTHIKPCRISTNDRFVYTLGRPADELNFPLSAEERLDLDKLGVAGVETECRQVGWLGQTVGADGWGRRLG